MFALLEGFITWPCSYLEASSCTAIKMYLSVVCQNVYTRRTGFEKQRPNSRKRRSSLKNLPIASFHKILINVIVFIEYIHTSEV